MVNIYYNNVKIEQYENTNQVIVKGQVVNAGARTYNAIAVRLIIFTRNVAIANVVFTINGLLQNSSKEFSKVLDDLDYKQVAKSITHYEVYTESAY